MRETRPTLYVVAGPNGCGKSTFTRSRFRGLSVIDPDAIARQLSPETPADAAGTAGRTAVLERRRAIAKSQSFALETTLAGRGVLRLMERAKAAGYRVELHFISVASVEVALARISSRVDQGGHDVPEVDVRRRFRRAQANLPAAVALSDEARLYDNTAVEQPYREVEFRLATCTA